MALRFLGPGGLCLGITKGGYACLWRITRPGEPASQGANLSGTGASTVDLLSFASLFLDNYLLEFDLVEEAALSQGAHHQHHHTL